MNTSRSHPLAQLAQAATLIRGATAAFAGQEPDPGHAAYFALLVEHLGGQLARAQLHAVDAVRRTGAHQLDPDSFQAISDAGLDPGDTDLAATCGRTTSGRSYYSNTVDLLHGWLNIPLTTARERVNQAEALIAAVSETGLRSAPLMPELAGEFTGQDADPRLLASAARQIRGVKKDLGAGPDAAGAQEQLERDAITLIRDQPRSTRKHMNRLVEQAVAADRPFGALLAESGLYRRGMKRGLVTYQLKILPQDAELFESVFTQIDNPKTIAGNRDALTALVANRYGTAVPTSDSPVATDWADPGSMPEWARETTDVPASDDGQDVPDPATGPVGATAGTGIPAELSLPLEDVRPEFRHLIALIELIRGGGIAPGGQRAGAVTPKVMVILNYEKMLAGATDFAITANGLPLSAGEARAVLCQAKIYPEVLGAKGMILDFGRSRRLFPQHVGKAIRAAYRGCSYPGCTMPAHRCELDHLDPWEKGGATNVDNVDLYCKMHHLARHCGLFKVVKVQGCRPMVLLPRDLDPPQRLRVNTYWMTPSEAIAANKLAEEATLLYQAGELQPFAA